MSALVDSELADEARLPRRWADASERALGHLTRPKSASQTTSMAFIVVLACAIGAIDYASGIRVSMTVFYLVPILLATAWFGWLPGVAAAVASVCLRITGDYLTLDEGMLPLWSVWNSFSALVVFLFIVWVSSNLLNLYRRLEQRVFERTAALSIAADRRRRLEHDVLMIATRERSAMGQELHDDVCQHLVCTTLAARVLTQRLSQRDPDLVADAEQIIAMVEDGIARTRGLARGLLLSAIEPDDLPERLADLADEIGRGGVACGFVDGGHDGTSRLEDAAVAAQLYRIAQEAARNALRHAHARRIDIALCMKAGALSLTIDDDGHGIVEGRQAAGMGLEIMAHRAAYIGATLTVEAATPRGTRVTCRMPFVVTR